MGRLHDNTITNKLLAVTDIAVLRDKKLLEQLSAYVNELIIHDFDYLVALLYRVDVDEKKIKELLSSQKDANAGELIAGLIIKRQEQKIKSREQFKPPTNIPEEEKW